MYNQYHCIYLMHILMAHPMVRPHACYRYGAARSFLIANGTRSVPRTVFTNFLVLANRLPVSGSSCAIHSRYWLCSSEFGKALKISATLSNC